MLTSTASDHGLIDSTWDRQTHPERWYFRSDHLPYARANIPALFFTTLLHEDYHTPTDTIEKIEFDRLHQRALLVFHTAWVLANQEERIVVDKPVK